jgi:prolyl-tRNA synthetase
MRYSKTLIPTLKEDPQDAALPSHRLMVRGGFIRQVAAGTFTFLPVGLRTLHKVTEIVREEMDRAGAIELLMPALQPMTLWQETGRDTVMGPVLIKITDRKDRELVLGPTHEEVITDTARQYLRSYRQLPINLYQIQTKFRDEERPRGGVIRAREFIMKDAYSFDRDEKGLDASYDVMYTAYTRIFTRCGLKFLAVEADPGAIGGSMNHEFMVPSPYGEDTVVKCDACEYAANVERCEVPAPTETAPGNAALKEVATPNTTTIEQVTAFLKKRPDEVVKTLIYKAGDKVVAALVRGDHELNEAKLGRALGTAVEMADPGLVTRITGARVGFAGPVDLGKKGVKIIADNAIKAMMDFVTGANKDDAHLINVNRERDFAPEMYADIRAAGEGDACPRCGKKLSIIRAIEVGHVFKLGTKYSAKMGAEYLDEEGKLHPAVMGCYGIGVSRILAAAIECHYDEKGIIWPISIAPYEVLIVPTNPKDEAVVKTAETIYNELLSYGVDTLIDDRDERAGVKFNDAELLGIPVRVTVGPRGVKNGVVEVKLRDGAEQEEVKTGDAARRVRELRAALFEKAAPGP